MPESSQLAPLPVPLRGGGHPARGRSGCGDGTVCQIAAAGTGRRRHHPRPAGRAALGLVAAAGLAPDPVRSARPRPGRALPAGHARRRRRLPARGHRPRAAPSGRRQLDAAGLGADHGRDMGPRGEPPGRRQPWRGRARPHRHPAAPPRDLAGTGRRADHPHQAGQPRRDDRPPPRRRRGQAPARHRRAALGCRLRRPHRQQQSGAAPRDRPGGIPAARGPRHRGATLPVEWKAVEFKKRLPGVRPGYRSRPPMRNLLA